MGYMHVLQKSKDIVWQVTDMYCKNLKISTDRLQMCMVKI